MACFTARVAAVASTALVMAPPTMTMDAPASQGQGGGLGVDASGHGDGYRHGLGYLTQHVPGGLALHLLVDGQMDAHVVGAHRLDLFGAGHHVCDLDHVHHDLGAVVVGGLDTLFDGGVGGRAQHADHARAGLGCAFHFGTAGVHGLHVGDHHSVGPAGVDRADGLKPLALDERGPGFQPVRASRDRFFGHLQGAGKIDEVKSQLQYRFHEVVLLV